MSPLSAPLLLLLSLLLTPLTSSSSFLEKYAMPKKGVVLSNDFVDLKDKRLDIDVVIIIYTYGLHTTRYNITEMVFKHYVNVAQLFAEYAAFTFTIVGSEGDLSRDLTLKYFSEDSYFEVAQAELLAESTYQEKCDVVSGKIKYGMRASYARETHPDLLFWAGSNDYVCFNFWRQVIESYNPNRLMLYGIDNFHSGENTVFYTTYNGRSLLSRQYLNGTFWHTGIHAPPRDKFVFVGGVIGVTRAAIRRYPHILERWDCDEGQLEDSTLHIPHELLQPSHHIFKFNSKYCFFMNIKMPEAHFDVTTMSVLKEYIKNTHQLLDETAMLPSFLQQFDEEFSYFNDKCAVH